MFRRLLFSLALSLSPRGTLFATQFIEKKGSTDQVSFSPGQAGIGSVGGVMYSNHTGTLRAMMEAAAAGVTKIIGGEVTLDGTNPTSVTTGLTTIVAAFAQVKKNSTPGDDPVALTVNYSGGQLDIYAWKTDGTDPTLVASTNNSAVISWIAIGI